MALRKKLYYDINTGVMLNNAGYTAIKAFMASTGANFGVASPDRYGNLMDVNNFTGATGNVARCRQAIGAWFQCAAFTVASVGSLFLGGASNVDFLQESTSVVVPDPATVRRPRVRLRLSVTSGGSVQGVLYVQRQHSIEV